MMALNLLWDFDGTLFDTYPGYTKSLAAVLGSKAENDEIYQKLKLSYAHAVEFYDVSAEQEKQVKQLMKQLPPEDLPPFEGVETILKAAGRNVIMTHKQRDGVLDILSYYGWEKYFIDMVTIDDGFPRKPDPAAYEYLHNKHNIDLAIGDRELDLLPAKKLGITTCMFQGTSDIADYHINHYYDFFNSDFPWNQK